MINAYFEIMKNPKILSKAAICAISAILGMTSVHAQEGAVVANQVKSIDDLKNLQKQIQAVVAKVQPATVALTSSKTGASGSGVIVNKEGLILTAAHVVQGNEEINVVLPNGKVYVANVLGANRSKDTAMVQLVKKQDWPFAEMGDSDRLAIGSYVISMGHAGGFDPLRKPPVRFGRLISKNRTGFVSTDCTLIGGDSGGPLFDINGLVIGINSSIGNTLSTNNHAGISGLKEDWARLQKGDTWGRLAQNPLDDPERPVMGFRFDELRDGRGVIIAEVVKDSPAEKAKMQVGDVIQMIGNEKIKDGRDLLISVNRYNAGDVIKVTILRKGGVQELNMKLVKREKLFQE